MTQDVASSTGTFSRDATIDLTNDFNYKFTVNFGCSNTGGEGMAFVLQSGAWSVGTGGAGLGYGGVANSLAIEFDTRDNEAAGENTFGDTPADHISIQTNGVYNHNTLANNLNPGTPPNPPNIIPGVANVEDCNDHTVEIIWIAGTQTLEILVDGQSSFGGPVNLLPDNIITTVFGGNPLVKWGWTGTTNVATNVQKVCLALEPQMTFTPTNCPGDAINFTGSAWAFNTITDYVWDFDILGNSTQQNPVITFPTAGNHPITLTITDDQGCTNTESFNIGVGFNVDVTADTNIVCPGGGTQLHVEALPFSGNDCCFDLKLTDLWDDGWAGNNVEVFVDGVSIGTYSPAVQGLGQAYVETHQLCFNQDAVVKIVVDGQQFPGECSYELVDASGNTILQLLNGNGIWVDGDEQTFTVDCGITPPTYNYTWNNAGLLDDPTSSNPTVQNLITPTTFTVSVKDPATNCIIMDSITITPSDSIKAVISGNDTVCLGDDGDLTITFEGDGPYDLIIQDPNGTNSTITGITSNPYTYNGSINGNYTLISVFGNGTENCEGAVSGIGTITTIIPPNVTLSGNANYCDGDPMNPINVTSTNGGTVNWYTNSSLTGGPIFVGNNFTPSAIVGATTYYAQETEAILGCGGAAATSIITVFQIPLAPTVTGPTEYCEGETPTPLTAEMSLGGTANWYNNANVIVSPLTQYNPTLIVGNICYYVNETANGCTGDSTEVCVLTKPVPTAPVITGNLIYCEGATPTPLTATPTIGGTITWLNSNSTTIGSNNDYTPDLTLGNQTFTASESLNGCTGPPETVSITVNILPTVNIPEKESMCYGDSLLITAVNNGFDLLWSNGDTLETSWLNPEVSSIIYITATNPLCGSVTDSIDLTVYELPIVTAGNDTVIGIGGEAILWASGTNSFTWSPEPSSCIIDDCSEIYVIPNQATVYVVDGIDENSCHNYDTVLVDISGYMEVFIPNVFSPNDDGSNDYLVVDGPRLFNYKIEIYDRWGKRVFISTEQKDSWDGKFNGNPLAPQTFVYMVKGETVLGEEIQLSGNITIVK